MPVKESTPVRLLDLAVLLIMVHRGAKEEKVGFEDCNETLESLTERLNKYVSVEKPLLESALWSANLMDEIKKFWHPNGLTFDEFAKKVCGKKRFNKTYNWIEE